MATPALSWMEHRGDDTVLADLLLGRREVVVSEIGPLAGRIISQVSEPASSYPLVVRYAIATMYLGGALERENQDKASMILRLAAETWESLGDLNAQDAHMVCVADAVVFLPFTALRYASVMYRELGDVEATARCRDALRVRLAEAPDGRIRHACDAWLGTRQGQDALADPAGDDECE